MAITTTKEMKKLEGAITILSEAFGEEDPMHLFGFGFTKNLEYEEMVKASTALKQLKELVQVIDNVLEAEGPYIVMKSNGTDQWVESVSREEILEFYLEVAMQEITEIIEVGEEAK